MRLLACLAISCAISITPALGQGVVLIIESQSPNSGHSMDTQWAAVANSAGYTVVTGDQADLAATTFHASTDILIVSSGIIGLTPAASSSIGTFLAQGGNVYLQGEFLITFTTNLLFETLVNANGGSFAWTSELGGDLQPVTVSAPLDGPLMVAPLDYHWYGATGDGTGVDEAMHDPAGNPVGWTFEATSGGHLVHTTDQDWVNSAGPEDQALMENILSWLNDGAGLGTEYCAPAVANSTGMPGRLRLSGSAVAADNNLVVRGEQLPTGEFAYFIASRTTGFVANPGGSMGHLCILGNIARFNRAGEVGAIAGGQFHLQLPLTDFPEPPANGVTVLAGDTWSFQCWHRDFVNGSPTSNFTSAVTLTFN